MRSDTVSATYEPCPLCRDGSCRKCGPASGEHAGPGVRLVLRRVRFALCGACNGSTGSCVRCGPEMHPRAAAGVVAEIVEERATRRWVQAIHLRRGDGARCGYREEVGDDGSAHFTDVLHEVTCGRCLRFSRRKQRDGKG